MTDSLRPLVSSAPAPLPSLSQQPSVLPHLHALNAPLVPITPIDPPLTQLPSLLQSEPPEVRKRPADASFAEDAAPVSPREEPPPKKRKHIIDDDEEDEVVTRRPRGGGRFGALTIDEILLEQQRLKIASGEDSQLRVMYVEANNRTLPLHRSPEETAYIGRAFVSAETAGTVESFWLSRFVEDKKRIAPVVDYTPPAPFPAGLVSPVLLKTSKFSFLKQHFAKAAAGKTPSGDTVTPCEEDLGYQLPDAIPLTRPVIEQIIFLLKGVGAFRQAASRPQDLRKKDHPRVVDRRPPPRPYHPDYRL